MYSSREKNLDNWNTGCGNIGVCIEDLSRIEDLSKTVFPGAFNGFFILVPWAFHCQFHIYSLALSMDFSFLYLGYFIVNFISIP